MGFSSTATWGELPRIWWEILSLYYSLIFRFREMHPDLPNGVLLGHLDGQARDAPVEISLPTEFADDFNSRFNGLKSSMLQELGEPNFTTILAGSMVVRVLQCFVVYACGWCSGLAVGLLQFLVAPLSLTASFIRMQTNISDCILHYVCCGLVAVVLAATGVSTWCPHITINTYFIVLFFTIDFVLNIVVHMNTSETFGPWRMAIHIVYGTFNTKTYFVVVLGCLLGFQIDLVLLCLASLLGLAARRYGLYAGLLRLSGWPCFAICFYVEHRIGHLPVNYQHAHKMHHYLHDSTAFDAHIYGSGMNEEYFWILAEVIPCLLAPNLFFPYFLNLETLYQSWTNKGAHTRSGDGIGAETFGCFDEDNYHADHHTLHRANFGSSTGVLLDFYFGTEGDGTQGVGGLRYSKRPDSSKAGHTIFRMECASGGNRAPRVATYREDSVEHLEESVESGQGVLHQDGGLRVITKEELALKRSRDSGGVWVALHGAVFDLTAFHLAHPGGPQVILSHAGSDATSTFAEVGHSAAAKAMSAKRLIGRLEGSCPSGFVAELLEARAAAATAPGSWGKLESPLLGK